MIKRLTPFIMFSVIILTVLTDAKSQDRPANSVYKEPITTMWINTYGNIRISNLICHKRSYKKKVKKSIKMFGIVKSFLYIDHVIKGILT